MNTEREWTLARWRTEIRNVISDLAQGCEEAYPVEAVRHLLALGVQRLSLDPGVGGEGLGMRGLAVVLEDLAAVDGSLAAIIMGTDGANAFLAANGTPSQRQGPLTALLAGEGVAAMAVTEPEAGTDVSAIRTACRRLEDGRWRLDGRKAFISNTGHPLWRFAIVLAKGPDRKSVV